MSAATAKRDRTYLERSGNDPDAARLLVRRIANTAGRRGAVAKRERWRAGASEMITAKAEREPFVVEPEQAWDNADDWWRDCASRAIAWLAELGAPFEAYDLTELGVPDPDHPARWGGAFAAARAAGLIVGTRTYAPSRRPGRHGSVVRLWRGKTR